MSARAMHWAMAIIQTGQLEKTISPKLVLLKLADRADDSGKCWPSHSRTSNDLKISEGTVRTSIKYLRDRGVIKVIHRKSEEGDVNLANVYCLQIPDQFGTVSGSRGRPDGVGQISTHPVGQIPTRGGSKFDPESKKEAKSKSSSSTHARGRLPAPADSGSAAAKTVKDGKQNKALRIVHGVHCWSMEDQHATNALMQQHGQEAVQRAAQDLTEGALLPLPGRVAIELQRLASEAQAAARTHAGGDRVARLELESRRRAEQELAEMLAEAQGTTPCGGGAGDP